jgi:Holliday junction resolvasome RuvABC endonuclease subunit
VRVLGIDPSLTNYGWAVHDTGASGLPRCPARGRFRSSASTLFVDRYIGMREDLRALVRDVRPDRVGLEFPVFDNLFSEGMYGLFLYTCEALKAERCDVVFWSPLQVKAHARESLGRPPKWQMMKPDMVEAAKADTGGTGRWNHNEADAYLVARLAGRFWLFVEGGITEADLTTTERKYFAGVHTYTKGSRAGEIVHRGVMYREDERFFRWSNIESNESEGAYGEGDDSEEGGRRADDGGPGCRQEGAEG